MFNLSGKNSCRIAHLPGHNTKLSCRKSRYQPNRVKPNRKTRLTPSNINARIIRQNIRLPFRPIGRLVKCRLKRKYVSDGILFSVRKYQAGSAVFIAAAAFSGKRTVVWTFAFKAFTAFFETVGFLETVFLKAVFFETVFFMAFAA